MEQRHITLAIIRQLPHLDPVEIDQVVEKVFPTIMAALTNGHEVKIPQFGKFVTHDLKAHRRRLPSNGEWVDVPARKQAKFIPSRRGFAESLRRVSDAAIPTE